jgi:hypothetical protein
MHTPSTAQVIARDRFTSMAFGVAGGGTLLGLVGFVTSVVDRDPGRLVVAVLGLLVAGAGTVVLQRRLHAVRRALAGRVVRAMVLDVMASGNKARVRYRFDADGRPVEGVHVAWFEHVPVVGEPIEVTYDPANPGVSLVLSVFR